MKLICMMVRMCKGRLMRKILFLDFDGVLNSWQTAIMERENPRTLDIPVELESLISNFDERNVWCLKYIVKNVPGIEIVISSSWRKSFPLDDIRRSLAFFGLDSTVIAGVTPALRMSGITRGEEIRQWMEDNLHGEEVSFIILDDYSVGDFEDDFLKTDQMNGLVFSDAVRAIKHLNPTWKQPVILM